MGKIQVGKRKLWPKAAYRADDDTVFALVCTISSSRDDHLECDFPLPRRIENEYIVPPSRRMIDIVAYCIPKPRRILPFIYKARLFTLHQFCYIRFRLNAIAISPNWICHIESTLRMLLACSSLAAPFWAFYENSTCSR